MPESANDIHVKADSSGFAALANAVPAMVWVSDVAKSCTWFNRGWLDFTGRLLDEENGLGWMKGIHPDDFNSYLKAYHFNFDSRAIFEIDYRLLHNSGEYRWVVARGAPRYDDKGEFAGYIGICLDIHDRLAQGFGHAGSFINFKALSESPDIF